MNDKPSDKTLPVVAEADALLKGAMADAGFEKMLKYVKGKWIDSEGVEYPMGSKFVAHCVGYTKAWVKFKNREFVEKHLYRVGLGEVPPERDQLDDNDQSKWSIGISGFPSDPWVQQSLLPLEDDAGDILVFIASSFGGRRAIADLVRAYSQRTKRTNVSEQPIILLKDTIMNTKRFGAVQRPFLEIVGWDNGEGNPKPAQESLKDEMNDEIPF